VNIFKSFSNKSSRHSLWEQYSFNKTKTLKITFIPKRLSFVDQLDICIVYTVLTYHIRVLWTLHELLLKE
jgi:hypothetical protein